MTEPRSLLVSYPACLCECLSIPMSQSRLSVCVSEWLTPLLLVRNMWCVVCLMWCSLSTMAWTLWWLVRKKILLLILTMAPVLIVTGPLLWKTVVMWALIVDGRRLCRLPTGRRIRVLFLCVCIVISRVWLLVNLSIRSVLGHLTRCRMRW